MIFSIQSVSADYGRGNMCYGVSRVWEIKWCQVQSEGHCRCGLEGLNNLQVQLKNERAELLIQSYWEI